MNKIGFVYIALVPEAPPVIDSLIEALKLRENSWICSAADLNTAPDLLEQTTLIVVAGGDKACARGLTQERGALWVIVAHDFLVGEEVEPWVRQA